MRAGRLVDMLLLLQRRGRLTAGQLAAELEVSPRTVLRDVDALGQAGVPIFTVQGVHGGIELVDGFRTDLTGMTADDAAVLLLAGQPAVADRLGSGAAAATARRKLLASLVPERRAGAERLDEWFVHDPDPWDGYLVPYGELRRLASAIQRQVAVTIAFADRAQETVRPLGLALKAGEWHLVVYGTPACEVRGLRGLRGLRITGRSFDRSVGFDLHAAWRTHVEVGRG